MPLPRPLVQFALNFFKELLRDVREVRALGDILTNESVGVLVGSTLPRMVRSGKEDAHTCGPRNAFVLCELQAIVSSNVIIVGQGSSTKRNRGEEFEPGGFADCF